MVVTAYTRNTSLLTLKTYSATDTRYRSPSAAAPLLVEIDQVLQSSTSSVHASTANHGTKEDRPASIHDPSHHTESPTGGPSSTSVVESVSDSNITNPSEYEPSSHKLGPSTSLVKEAMAPNRSYEVHDRELDARIVKHTQLGLYNRREVAFNDNVMEKTASVRSDVLDSFHDLTDAEPELPEILGASLSDLDSSIDSSPASDTRSGTSRLKTIVC
ncbi:hypothetical protein SeLEV6574_g05473 [Synchytrium endobioticum]|uniref:Uncharacterized protein n=1 Tax=Synchytrium endobioticum TaxID=286115 RepID=A0A507CU25_9FUNG|nr:hypothetical protein SeLEV6574_g05473 [Synchytrium endobioticum]